MPTWQLKQRSPSISTSSCTLSTPTFNKFGSPTHTRLACVGHLVYAYKDAYKDALNAATNEVRKFKRNFEQKLAQHIKSDSKSFYAYVRSKQNVRDRVGPLEDSAGNIITQGVLMAEEPGVSLRLALRSYSHWTRFCSGF